jgi:helix-turn-helix protein
MLTKQQKRTIVMHSRDAYVCRIPTEEALTAMKELTDTAYKLLIYYYSKSTGWNFSDLEIGRVLGVTERTVQTARKELVDKEYLLVEKGKNIDNYFIGKRAVFEWKFPKDQGDDL